jgi:hypothetical protein
VWTSIAPRTKKCDKRRQCRVGTWCSTNTQMELNYNFSTTTVKENCLALDTKSRGFAAVKCSQKAVAVCEVCYIFMITSCEFNIFFFLLQNYTYKFLFSLHARLRFAPRSVCVKEMFVVQRKYTWHLILFNKPLAGSLHYCAGEICS